MFQRILKVGLLSLVVSVIPSNFQVANSTEILWNPGVSNDLSGAGAGLVPGAGIRNTGLLVNKSNPDELIMKIIMSDSFEDRPFSGKGRNMAMWIYWPTNYCWSKETANCEGLFTIGVPINPASYPTTKSSEYVFIFKHDKASNVNKSATSCKAPWWIESTYKSRDTWAFAVSITCLGIPKEFGWYAYSSIDLGQKDIVTDFTAVQSITYPFHELAAKAYTSTSSTEKQEMIKSLKASIVSGKKQAKNLKPILTKTKSITKAKKKTYFSTIRAFKSYAKNADTQILQLEALPYDDNFKSKSAIFIQEWMAWLNKLNEILKASIKG